MRTWNKFYLAFCIATLLLSACGREGVRTLDPVQTPASNDAGPVLGEDSSSEPFSDALPARSDRGHSLFDGGDAQPPFIDGGPGPDADASTAMDAELPRPDAQSADAAIMPDSGQQLSPDASAPHPDAGPADGGHTTIDAGVMPACLSDQDCHNGQVCDPNAQICVECYQNSQCGFGQACDSNNGNICRWECWGGNRCRPGQVCDQSSNFCVDCLSNSDCGSNAVCDAASRGCVECLMDSDCANTIDRPLCALNQNICIECLSNADCAAPETCDANFECRAANNRPLCEPCNDDNQCGSSDDFCVGYYYGPNNYVDRSCAQDCSNSPCPRGFDCVTTRSGTAQQCRPEYDMQTPTCEAIRHLGASCPYSSSSRDPGCGISNVQDARCVQDSSSPLGGICTVWCQNNDECPLGFTCFQQPSAGRGYCL